MLKNSLKIKPSDVGRSITDFHLGLSEEELEKLIRTVTTKSVGVSQEVSGGQGRVYELHIQPYLTGDKKIDGAVLSFGITQNQPDVDGWCVRWILPIPPVAE